MRRWLLRFGYAGSSFRGWARQPRLPTVEGTLRAALRRRGIASDADAARLEVASRTDRGVSARSNVLALSSPLLATPLLARLNSISPAIFFTAVSPVAPEFRVRSAARRVYRYFEPGPALSPVRWRRAADLFQGRVDVRSFGRGVPARAPQWRTVEGVRLASVPGGRMVEVRAPSFVWGMVRKIVGALREVDVGRLSLSRLEAAIGGEERLTLPLAEPEGLVLWSVEYPDVRWEAVWNGPNRHQAKFTARDREALWQRESVLRALSDSEPAPP